MRGFILGVVVTLVLVGLVGYGLVRSGRIPANADAKAGGLEVWAANTSLAATLKRAAPSGPNPVPLTDANLIEGVRLYGSHCAICHGASGGSTAPTAPSVMALRAAPRPPRRSPGANIQLRTNSPPMASKTIRKATPIGRSSTASG